MNDGLMTREQKCLYLLTCFFGNCSFIYKLFLRFFDMKIYEKTLFARFEYVY